MDLHAVTVTAVTDSPPVGSPPEIADSVQVSQPSVETKQATVTLTDDLRQKIIKQVEYYFSDENLQTDKFMMNQLSKNKDGFVPISVIASFKKLKKLAPDRSLIVAALKDSSLLVLSSSKKKVKRLHPLPVSEVTDPKLCTVLVENLPEDHSVENIRKMFCKAGNIKNIRVHEPNASGEHKNRTLEEKLRDSKLHAFVEYETVEEAEKAVVTLNDEQDWRFGMRVKLLKQRGKHGQKKTARKVAGSENNVSVQTSDAAGEEDNIVPAEHHDNAPGEKDAQHLAKEKNGHKGRNRGRARRQNYTTGSNGLGHGTVSNHVVGTSKPPPGPRMPDGTRGFTMGRGRPLAPQQS